MITPEQKLIITAIGDNLRVLRIQKGFTQKQIAFELGTSRAHYRRIENGLINTGILHLFKLAEILDIKIADLISSEKIISLSTSNT